MTQKQRDHLYSNTAVMLGYVSDFNIQLLYLAQQYRTKPSYAHAIYDLMAERKFYFSEVEKASEGAEDTT